MDRPDPDDYQPPLTRWGHAWRYTVCLVLSTMVWSTAFQNQWNDHRWLWFVDLGVGVAAYVLVAFRRRHPFGIAVVLTLMSLVSGVAAGPGTLAAVSLATRQRRGQIAVVGVLGILCYQVYAEMFAVGAQDPYWVGFGFNVVATLGMLGWGMYIGSRRQLLASLRQRAVRAEAEQEMRAAQARGTERARIAREMHDVLAHRISQISLHAGAMSFRDDLDADAMRDSARVVQAQAHEALTELRDVLGVLRDTDTGELTDRPQPTYADLGTLVEDARASGLALTYRDRVETNGTTLPDVAGRTVYRIVQEGITNARKHAPGAVLSVEVSGDPEAGIDVRLRNPIGFGPSETPGSGLGLIGLAERAALRGGRLDHRRHGREFELHGWIPWRA
ncbi:MAG: sensor histidine kinase [Nocardioides sp.]